MAAYAHRAERAPAEGGLPDLSNLSFYLTLCLMRQWRVRAAANYLSTAGSGCALPMPLPLPVSFTSTSSMPKIAGGRTDPPLGVCLLHSIAYWCCNKITISHQTIFQPRRGDPRRFAFAY